MQKMFLRWGAILAALSVALGAFGAHALKQVLSEKSLATFETGVRYQFYHAFALLAAGILYKEFPNKYVQFSGRLFILGIILFSGSLYGLAALELTAQVGLRWIGAITPLGGLCFILGWLLLAVGVSKKS